MKKLLVYRVLLKCLILLLLTFYSVGENNTKNFLKRNKRWLFFPQYSTLQTSMCLIAQISSLPSHRVALNIGFQTNYQLPYQVSSYYSPVFWARKFSETSNPLINFFEKMATEDEIHEEMSNKTLLENTSFVANTNLFDTIDLPNDSDYFKTSPESKQNDLPDSMDDIKHIRKRRMLTFESDISAGLFYDGINDILEYAGYHEACLLKSVCELAKHPLHFDDKNEDLSHEILHLLLTPSAHKSFDSENEIKEKELYEEAEKIGRENGDCEFIYSECKVSPLYSISNFIPFE